jgi:trk system potassium uptake protein TrkH
MNYTPGLTTSGKLIIALVMFVGRIGPLTLALGLAKRRQRSDYRYAEESVMVG